MLVETYMTPNPITISVDGNLREALKTLVMAGRHLLVVNDQDELVGIISDRDLRLVVNSPLVPHDQWEDDQLLSQTKISEIMSSPVISIEPEAWVSKAAELMLEYEVSALPVVNHRNKLVGIITVTDLMRALVRSIEDQVLKQPDEFSSL